VISGRMTRLLLDASRVSADEAGLWMSRALAAAVPPPAAAGWAEGFLAGSGLLLVHDDKMLALADGWLAGLTPEAFTAVLPALRRTFGEFAPPERRAIGQKAALLDGSGRGSVGVADRGDDPRRQRRRLRGGRVPRRRPRRGTSGTRGRGRCPDPRGDVMTGDCGERMRRWRLVLGEAGGAMPLR